MTSSDDLRNSDEAKPYLPAASPPCPQTTALDAHPSHSNVTDQADVDFEFDIPDLGSERYELQAEIQRGGVGLIFRAFDRQLPREVAVKVLRAEHANHPLILRSFANEARIMSYLSHPGVTPVYECGHCTDGRPFHVMKLIDGATLSDLLHRRKVSCSQLLGVFFDICQTMAFAHSRGVIHSDLKPGNVMVGEFGEVNVTDWGSARFINEPPPEFAASIAIEASSTEPVPVHGTPDYMSPEQARGKPLDLRADVFGLGAILCEILIGHAPYEGKTVRQIYAHAVRGSMNSTLAGLENCNNNRELVRLAKRCLSTSRRERPANAGEVAQAVAAYQDSALRRIESDMERFFDLSLDLFCIADLQGFFLRINSNFSRVLGYSTDQLLSRPFLDFVHPDDINQTMQQMEMLNAEQPVVRFRNRYRTSGGPYVVLEWTAKTIHDEQVVFAVARVVTATNRLF